MAHYTLIARISAGDGEISLRECAVPKESSSDSH
jgi:hypothetical protein